MLLSQHWLFDEFKRSLLAWVHLKFCTSFIFEKSCIFQGHLCNSKFRCAWRLIQISGFAVNKKFRSCFQFREFHFNLTFIFQHLKLVNSFWLGFFWVIEFYCFLWARFVINFRKDKVYFRWMLIESFWFHKWIAFWGW